MAALGENRDFTRRKFIGTVTGAAALALLGLDRRALADDMPPELLVNDYIGRLCYNENPLGPSPAAIAAIREQAELAHRYPDWYAESLVSAIATKYQVATDTITCGSGATEILRLCAMIFSRSGKNVIVPNPSYTQFPTDAEFYGASVNYVSLNSNHAVDLQAMRNRVNSNTTAVCITNPNNPTATIVSASALESFVDSLPEYVATIIDEAYLEFIEGNYLSAIGMVREDKNVIVVKTFSKVHGLAGARVGFAVGRSTHIEQMRNRQYAATISRRSLEAAKAAINDNQHIQRTVDLATEAKEYCYRKFDQMGLSYIPSEGNFFIVNVATDADQIRSRLAQVGIYVRTGWGMTEYLRVSCGLMDEMKKFIIALDDILRGSDRGLSVETNRLVELYQASPNPFNSSTAIRIFLPSPSPTRLDVFDIQGRLVKRLTDGILDEGEHSFIWDGRSESGNGMATGAYFYKLVSGENVITRKLLLIK